MHLFFLMLPLFYQQVDEAPVANISVSQSGKPITVDTDDGVQKIKVGLGQQLRLSSDKATFKGISWFYRPATLQTDTFPNNDVLILTTPVEPQTISVLQIVSSNDVISIQELIIICGEGGLPPPNPKPTPTPDVPPKADKKFFISLVSNAKVAKVDELEIRNSIEYWNGLKLLGHDWIFFDSLTPESKGQVAIKAVQDAKITFPALVIDYEGKHLSVIPLPKTLEGIDAEIKRLGGVLK